MGARTPIGRGFIALLLTAGTLVVSAGPAAAAKTVSGSVTVASFPATVTRSANAVGTVTADITTTESATFTVTVGAPITATFNGGGKDCQSAPGSPTTIAANQCSQTSGAVVVGVDGDANAEEAAVIRVQFDVSVPVTEAITSTEGTTGQPVTVTVTATGTGTTTGTANGTANTTIVPSTSGGSPAESEVRVVTATPSPTSVERGPLAKTTYSATFQRAAGKTNQITDVEVQLLTGDARGTSVGSPTVSNDASPDACTTNPGTNCTKISFASGAATSTTIVVTFDVSVPASADTGTTSYAFRGTYKPITANALVDIENGDSKSFTVLTDTAPNTTIDSGPGGTADQTAEFAFSSDDVGATFECELTGPGQSAGFTTCTSPKTYTSLADGDYTFSVRAKDNIGNADPSPATNSFTVDNTAPVTTIDSGPGSRNDGSADFAFSSNESGSTFECELTGPGQSAGFSTCTSPQGYTGLADGDYTFSVKATDAAGNTDATPETNNFTMDGTAPTTTIDSGPGSRNDGSADFAFSSNESGTFECELTGPGQSAGFSTCTSPQNYTGLADGDYTFSVRAVDAAGNTDGSPETNSFTMDGTAPTTTIDTGPGSITDGTASFTFSSDDANATFECELTGPGQSAGFSTCTSPATYSTLADGDYTFTVKATDEAGNTDATPETNNFTMDGTPPTTSIDGGPGTVNDGTASFTFSSDDANATFECELTGPGQSAGFSTCTSPQGYTGLADGDYTFKVKATDTVGNTDTNPEVNNFTMDSAAPNTTIDSGPGTTGGAATFTFSSTEANSTFECELTGPGQSAGFTACTSPKSYTGLAAGDYTFTVKATDAAGNTDADPATSGLFTVAPATTGVCNGRAATIDGTPSSETIEGTPGNDVIVAFGGNDIVYGGGGNDVICGGTGDDKIHGEDGNDGMLGEAGNDFFTGGYGADRFSGGDGTYDRVSYSEVAHSTSVLVTIGNGKTDDGSYVDGPSTARDEVFSNVEGVIGGPGNDKLIGTGAANSLDGAGGNDTLQGVGGNDSLIGNAGGDFLYGGYGRDSVIGGLGADALFGEGDGDYLYAQDGTRDARIDGGAGSDVAYRDAIDPAPISVP